MRSNSRQSRAIGRIRGANRTGARAPSTAITSAQGELLYGALATAERVLDPALAYLVTHLLQGVIDSGTGRPARAAGLTAAAAGKTGTTDDTVDAWFIGYTPDIVAGVWVGLDSGAPMGLTGAQGALPIWTDFVRTAAGPDAPQAFPVPEGIVWRVVDPASGKLATASCPEIRHEPFLVGTEPHEPCPLHRPVLTALGHGTGGAVRSGTGALGTIGRTIQGWFSHLFH